jgi:hypothetical protein
MASAATEMPQSIEELVGRTLPGGRFRLEGYESRLMHDAFYSPFRPEPHPIAAYAATQRGVGMTVSELFETFGTTMDDGPLLASCTLDFPGEMHADTDYTVRAVIDSVARKETRSRGTVDFITCRMELIEAASYAVVAVVTNVYAIPRPHR